MKGHGWGHGCLGEVWTPETRDCMVGPVPGVLETPCWRHLCLGPKGSRWRPIPYPCRNLVRTGEVLRDPLPPSFILTGWF